MLDSAFLQDLCFQLHATVVLHDFLVAAPLQTPVPPSSGGASQRPRHFSTESVFHLHPFRLHNDFFDEKLVHSLWGRASLQERFVQLHPFVLLHFDSLSLESHRVASEQRSFPHVHASMFVQLSSFVTSLHVPGLGVGTNVGFASPGRTVGEAVGLSFGSVVVEAVLLGPLLDSKRVGSPIGDAEGLLVDSKFVSPRVGEAVGLLVDSETGGCDGNRDGNGVSSVSSHAQVQMSGYSSVT